MGQKATSFGEGHRARAIGGTRVCLASLVRQDADAQGAQAVTAAVSPRAFLPCGTSRAEAPQLTLPFWQKNRGVFFAGRPLDKDAFARQNLRDSLFRSTLSHLAPPCSLTTPTALARCSLSNSTERRLCRSLCRRLAAKPCRAPSPFGPKRVPCSVAWPFWPFGCI